MGRLSLRNVKEINGLLYFRRQIRGKDVYTRLPALDSPDFLIEYNLLAKPDTKRPPAPKGSIAHLVQAYRGSVAFKANSPTTRTNQGRYLDMIEEDHGSRTVAGVRPVHVYAMRDKLADMPGKANNWLSVFRSLMHYAIREGLRDTNPAEDVPILPIGEHQPWPVDLLRICLEVATPMTRLAIVTGLCSGQRIGDAIRMQYGWINHENIMEFTQQKVRKGGITKDVAVPMHPFWLEELAKLPRKSVTLLYERSGAPFQTTGAVQERIRALMAQPAVQEVLADLEARETIAEGSRFSFHGLRKNACCYLVETGLNDSEVGYVLGMSPEMVRHYSKRARALMVARGAAERVMAGKIAMIRPVNASDATAKNG